MKNTMSNGPLISDLDGIELSDIDKEFLLHPKLGGLILFTRNYESREQLIDLVRCIREIRPHILLSVDHEGGRVQRFRHGFSRLPPMGWLGEYHAESAESALLLSQDLGWLMASELCDVDIDHSFAPILDLDDNKSEVIADRAFSADADTASALAERFIDGMLSAGMQATAKHFPGHGSVVNDSHLQLPIDPRAFADIAAHDLRPFVSLMPKYAGIMTAHICFPQMDDLPVSFSHYWLNDVLRQDLGYDGTVFSDDLSMKGADNAGDFPQRAETALAAGCDAVLMCNHRRESEFTLEYLEQKSIGEHGQLERFLHKGIVHDKARAQRIMDQVDALAQRLDK